VDNSHIDVIRTVIDALTDFGTVLGQIVVILNIFYLEFVVHYLSNKLCWFEIYINLCGFFGSRYQGYQYFWHECNLLTDYLYLLICDYFLHY
jgi:hypothetical protein